MLATVYDRDGHEVGRGSAYFHHFEEETATVVIKANVTLRGPKRILFSGGKLWTDQNRLVSEIPCLEKELRNKDTLSVTFSLQIIK